MTSSETVLPTTPTSVSEIVMRSYALLKTHLWSLTRVSMPVILFSAIISGFSFQYMPQEEQAVDNWSVAFLATGMMLFSMLGLSYVIYVVLRYCKTVCANEAHPENLFDYLVPEKRLLGLVGMGCLYMVAVLVMAVSIVLGTILLILPGIAAIVFTIYGFFRVCLSMYLYMQESEAGILHAVRHSWQLTQGYVLRTWGLLFLYWIIQVLIGIIIFLIHVLLGIVNLPYFSALFGVGLPVLNTVLFGIFYWANYVVMFGIGSFIFYQYIADLKLRHALAPVVVTPAASIAPETPEVPHPNPPPQAGEGA